MFFTRFPVNKTRREARRLLGDPYAMHAAVAGSFPPAARGDAGGPGRVLWRLDDQRDGSLLLYIVSPSMPSLCGLDEQIGWPDLAPQWATRPYDAFLDRIREGRRYSFRLVANPVVSRVAIRGRSGDSRRIPHLTALQQAAWLIGADAYAGLDEEPPSVFAAGRPSRAERNGFRVPFDERWGEPMMEVSDMRVRRFRRGPDGPDVTLATARYDGVLEVTDADALRGALVNGIGHGKGFGCGMLTLALSADA